MATVRTSRDIGALIRGARSAAGLTQRQLAGEAGTTQKWISEVENGKETVELEMVLRVIRKLGMRLVLERSPTTTATPAPAPGLSPIDINAVVDRTR